MLILSSPEEYVSTIFGRLVSGINTFSYNAPYPGTYLGIQQESGSVSHPSILPGDINFVDITVPDYRPIVNPTGPNVASYTYAQSFYEPGYTNDQTARNSIGYAWGGLAPLDDLDIAPIFMKDEGFIQVLMPDNPLGITITPADINRLCYVQRDYPLGTESNTGLKTDYRIKLVKATTVLAIPPIPPFTATMLQLDFPAVDFHPSDFFNIILMNSAVDPWIDNWKKYPNRTQAFTALSEVGILLSEEFLAVTRLPDLAPSSRLPVNSLYPPISTLLGYDQLQSGAYTLTYSALIPAGPAPYRVYRNFFYGALNDAGTNNSFVVYNPQMGEIFMSVGVPAAIAPDFSTASGYLPNDPMAYYYTNKECPLNELGCSQVPDAFYDDGYSGPVGKKPAGIVSSRYTYQTDWNGITVTSPHYFDVLVRCAARFDSVVPDPYTGIAPGTLAAYFWKTAMFFAYTSQQINDGYVYRSLNPAFNTLLTLVPDSRAVLPCNVRGVPTNPDPTRYDGVLAHPRCKVTFSFDFIQFAGGWCTKFCFLVNQRVSVPNGNSNLQNISFAWADAEVTNFGAGWKDSKIYTLANAPNSNTPDIFDNSNNGLTTARMLRKRVFFNFSPMGFIPANPVGDRFTGAATVHGDPTFTVACVHYNPHMRVSGAVNPLVTVDVDNQAHLNHSYYGPQIKVIGVGFCDFTVRDMYIQAGRATDPQNPPNAYFAKIPGNVFLLDRLNNPAPFMSETFLRPTGAADVEIWLSPTGAPGSWVLANVAFTADSAGEYSDLYIQPRLSVGSGIFPGRAVQYLKVRNADGTVYDNTIPLSRPDNVVGPSGSERGWPLGLYLTGVAAGLAAEPTFTSSITPAFNGLSHCTGSPPGTIYPNILISDTPGTWTEVYFQATIKAEGGGNVLAGHTIKLEVSNTGGLTIRIGLSSAPIGAGQFTGVGGGPVEAPTDGLGNLYGKIVIDGPGIPGLFGYVGVVLRHPSGPAISTPYSTYVYSGVCPP
jgi:hypothetical protein